MTRKVKTEQSELKPYQQLPLHPKQESVEQPTTRLSASWSLVPNSNSVLFSIRPPLMPNNLERSPVDIALVIDTSGSMFSEAPLPGSQDRSESAALSILDLVKHAALTIVETLTSGDRLALITFSDDAKVCTSSIYIGKLI